MTVDPQSARPSLLPVHLEIESIAVATPLVKLGLMPGRTVEVPSDADRAGWFRFGPKPGRRGSAVILDTSIHSRVPPCSLAYRNYAPATS